MNIKSEMSQNDSCRLCMQHPGVHNIYEVDPLDTVYTRASRIMWVTQLTVSRPRLGVNNVELCSPLSSNFVSTKQALATQIGSFNRY